MDLSVVMAAVGIVAAIVGSNFALFLWARSESRADYRECRADNKHLEQKTIQLLEGIRSEVQAIHQEMKDFHGRLCSLEARWHEERTPRKDP